MTNREQQKSLVKCLVSGSTERSQLLKFVVSPSDELVPDLAERLPGQALWLTGKKSVLEQALHENQFSLAAGVALSWRDDLAVFLGQQMEAHLLSLIGLARKAGAIKLGFAKVSAALTQKEAQLLFCASDAAIHGRQKMTSLARQNGVKVCSLLPISALSAAMGRENIVHAVVTEKGWSERLDRDISRLSLYQAEDLDLDGEVSDWDTSINETVDDE